VIVAYVPNCKKLDKEASAALQHAMRKENIDYQLIPPHVNRRNAAERAIRTFKNHFSTHAAAIIR
jgi:hypothetical protein